MKSNNEFTHKLAQVSPLIRCILKSGNYSPTTGGMALTANLTFVESVPPTQGTLAVSAAQYGFKQIAVPVCGNEPAAETVLLETIAAQLLGDGTGNNSKDIDGVAAIVPIDVRSRPYGGIDGGVFAFWRPKLVMASQRDDVATSATIRDQWKALFDKLTRGSDKPNLILAGSNSFSLFQNSTDEPASHFEGAPVYMERGIPPDYTYFLNTDYLHYHPHALREAVLINCALDEGAAHRGVNLVWAGNLTCSNRAAQGLHANI